jgi:hypothetical protein
LFSKWITTRAAREAVLKMKRRRRVPFSHLFPHANSLALSLLERMLVFAPDGRCTVEEALAHPYLSGYRDPASEPRALKAFRFASDNDEGDEASLIAPGADKQKQQQQRRLRLQQLLLEEVGALSVINRGGAGAGGGGEGGGAKQPLASAGSAGSSVSSNSSTSSNPAQKLNGAAGHKMGAGMAGGSAAARPDKPTAASQAQPPPQPPQRRRAGDTDIDMHDSAGTGGAGAPAEGGVETMMGGMQLSSAAGAGAGGAGAAAKGGAAGMDTGAAALGGEASGEVANLRTQTQMLRVMEAIQQMQAQQQQVQQQLVRQLARLEQQQASAERSVLSRLQAIEVRHLPYSIVLSLSNDSVNICFSGQESLALRRQ